MKNSPRPAVSLALSPTVAAPADAFAGATARLVGDRPLRNPRLQQILLSINNNRLTQAERELAGYLARVPEDADALSLMARTLVRQGRHADALPFLDRCLQAAPGFASARFNRAHLRLQRGAQSGALADLDHLLRDDPENPLFLEMRAQTLEAVKRSEEALPIWQRLAESHPSRTESWIRYGHALRSLGHQAQCVGAYRRAIASQPGSGLAYWALADLRTFRFDEGDIGAMQAQLQRQNLAVDDRATMHYALAKALEDRGEYERSFRQYEQGATALRPRFRYEPDNLSRGVDDNVALFTEDFFLKRAGAGCLDTAPIFVVSRPRSGSTLVDQMLSSHSAIEGVGELPFIRNLAIRLGRGQDKAYYTGYLRELAALDPAALRALGEEYLASVAPLRTLGRPYFVDKMPANFYYIGLIRAILPNARIIDVRRHPAACCLSIFKSFTRKGVLSLPELGRFYRDYVRLLAHFDRAQPGAIHRVTYEDLVSEPERELRGLLGYLGLPFEEGCLRFYENQRRVLTPSSEQVRRPIFGDAVNRWRDFEPWLGPLLDSLGEVHDRYPEVPVAWR